MSGILNWLDKHQGVAEWLTALAAITALVYAIKEFFLKRRPYIWIEIQYADNPDKTKGGWLFFTGLSNKGSYPGIAKIEKCELKIGDEIYPTKFKESFIIAPGESKKSALIGSIYRSGIKKVLGHEYRHNRVEIAIEVVSSDIGSQKYKYLTKALYQVVVSGEKPEFLLISEEFR